VQAHLAEAAAGLHQVLLRDLQAGPDGDGLQAYPLVVSSLVQMPAYVRAALKHLYDAETSWHFMAASRRPDYSFRREEDLGETQQRAAACMWQNMQYFTAQGYALGTAYASASSGDTVSTVLVGGMVTVRNDGFSCRAGEPIMWYFDFEEDMFHSKKMTAMVEGERRMGAAPGFRSSAPNEVSRKRRMADIYDSTKNDSHKDGVALPKPYVLKQGRDHFCDKIRVFAKCINGGRPYNLINIMIMTQSL